MKRLRICILTVSLILSNHIIFGQDSYTKKAANLKYYYYKVISGDTIRIYRHPGYKYIFFQEFPDNFKDFNAIFGWVHEGKNYHDGHPGILHDSSYHFINLFFSLENSLDEHFWRKVIRITKDAKWDADAVNFFQEGLREKVFQNVRLAVYQVGNYKNEYIKSFFYFFFDGVHPTYKSIPRELKKIKSYNKKVYHLMEQALKEVLKKDKEY